LGTLSQNYDAEIIATVANVFASIRDIVGDVTIRVGNRPFWNAVFEWLNVTGDDARNLMILIDKRAKLSESDFKLSLNDIVSKNVANEIIGIFSNGYRSILKKTDNIDAAIKNIDEFMELLSQMGVKNAKFDVGIVRGLAYYTGFVFETNLDKYPELGSVCGGGRYDNLADKFSKQRIVGVGCAAGISRMMVALMESGAIDLSKFENSVDAAVLVMGQNNVGYAIGVAAELRAQNIVAVPYLETTKKFKSQIEFADKISARFSIIIGDDEVKDKLVTVKNMTSGEQQKMTVKEAVLSLRAS
ncbi:MAG: histidine--tRNA ligase family protein, partial [Rickettsiales bacterium]|nr:histidine--tRNA ligase family protein [Rickettsiales bacterium]